MASERNAKILDFEGKKPYCSWLYIFMCYLRSPVVKNTPQKLHKEQNKKLLQCLTKGWPSEPRIALFFAFFILSTYIWHGYNIDPLTGGVAIFVFLVCPQLHVTSSKSICFWFLQHRDGSTNKRQGSYSWQNNCCIASIVLQEF